MPVVIKELIIRATVNEPSRGKPGSAGGGKLDALQQQALVREIVEQVLEIIEKKQER